MHVVASSCILLPPSDAAEFPPGRTGKDETTDAAEVCQILSKTNAVGGDKTDASTKVAILDAQVRHCLFGSPGPNQCHLL